ncbi:MAG: NADH-quinone oxidoreductase subunit NuoE [Desulfobacterales bacterium]|nr:NADH-quinone oxidoreductase subunit NuoE [Desulfobacterales bacterium]
MSQEISAEEEAGIQEEEKIMVEDIISRLSAFGKERVNLIPVLQMIQKRHAYLSPESIGLVAEYLKIARAEVYGVATFYNQFRFNPPGKHQIKVCLGTACHVRGGDIILENFERKLGIEEGRTTPDREFSIERVACVGCCALAPVGVIDDIVQGNMAPSKVEGIILGFEIEKEKAEREKQENGSGQ